MRLIDADALIKFIDAGHLRHQEELAFSELDVVNMLREQPTAFDVEKVIEILGILREGSTHVSCPDEECEDCKYFGDCNDCDYADVHALDKAIEIVKRGGIDEE